MLLSLAVFASVGCAQPNYPLEPKLHGKLEIYVTDAPPEDEVTSIIVTVSKAEIQAPSDNGQAQDTGEWISIGLAEGENTFDLLEIRGVEQLLGGSQVEPGQYNQVRLILDTIEIAFGEEEPREATLPSQEIRMSQPFTVAPDQTTTLVFDFDADESVQVAGAPALAAVESDTSMQAQRAPSDNESVESMGAPEIIFSPVVKLTVR
jgi:hypothetical protein